MMFWLHFWVASIVSKEGDVAWFLWHILFQQLLFFHWLFSGDRLLLAKLLI